MRRLTPLLLATVSLAGCSGLGKFESDTLTLPGANPNKPAGASETMLRVEDRPYEAPPLGSEPGNIWPGQPKPFPTLGEVERETQQAGQNPANPPSTNAIPPPPGGARFQMKANPNSASTIVIPNGNGTSTVISPDGSVRVIPTPKGAASPGAGGS